MVQPVKRKSEVQCPQCGQFTGAASRCGHCGMRLEKRMGLRMLRITAMATALGGLLLLHLYSTHRELPLVGIGEISPVMNFATVRIQGTLESDARKLRGGSVLYVVDDGTGTLAAFADPPKEGQLPLAGSRIFLEGSLNVGAGDEVRMNARSVVVAPVAVAGTKIAEVTGERKGDRLTVSGKVAKLWAPRAGSRAPHKIILEDDSGTLEVVHWLEDFPQVAVGDALEVRGSVDVYKQTVQLKVWDAADLHLLE